MNGWRAGLEAGQPILLTTGSLSLRAAAAVAALLTSGAYDGARLVECRTSTRSARTEGLWLDVDVPIGQLAVINDIRASEPVAVVFSEDGTPPAAYPLRGDFPEGVPHLNMSPPGRPRSLCLYEMLPEDVLRIATPHALLERIRWWLVETAHGALHGEDQPLDPLFCFVGDSVLLPVGGITGLGDADLTFVQGPEGDGAPLHLMRTQDIRGPNASLARSERHAAMVVLTDAVAHVGINRPPATLGDLIAVYAGLGVDVVAPLRAAFRRWIGRHDLAEHLKKPWLLLLATPIERSPGKLDALMTKGFQTEATTAGEVAEAIGALLIDGKHVGRPILDAAPAADIGAGIVLRMLDLRQPMTRGLARAASGRIGREGDDREVALVGAGAVGSQLAMTAARMGIGTWSIIDNDFLLPHNIARHALLSHHVGISKALALATEIGSILGPGSVKSLRDVASAPEAAALLRTADLVIDASASVSAARHLARQSDYRARTVSAFLNPAGTDLVILCEGQSRTPRIDHVEMAYYWLLVTEGLGNHLAPTGSGIRPSGGCRVPSLQIPQSRIGTLASFAVERIFRPLPDEGSIEIVHMSADGLTITRTTAPRCDEVAISEFTVAISSMVVERVAARRAAADGDETGGILIGSWDRRRNVLYVVAANDAPMDSIGTPTGFERGVADVHRTLDEIDAATGGNLTYVGEWHSHPPGAGTRPSDDDRILLRWIARNLEFLDVPPCMIIAGDGEIRIVLRSHKESAIVRSDA